MKIKTCGTNVYEPVLKIKFKEPQLISFSYFSVFILLLFDYELFYNLPLEKVLKLSK